MLYKVSKFFDEGDSLVYEWRNVVSKIGAVVVIFFACVGKIFGAIPDQTGSVEVFYNVVVLRLCVVRKMCYIINLYKLGRNFSPNI